MASAICRWEPPPTSPCCASRKARSASSTCTARGWTANERLVCELTLRDGKVLYDLNGLSRPDWRSLPADYRQTGDARWDGMTPAPIRR